MDRIGRIQFGPDGSDRVRIREILNPRVHRTAFRDDRTRADKRRG